MGAPFRPSTSVFISLKNARYLHVSGLLHLRIVIQGPCIIEMRSCTDCTSLFYVPRGRRRQGSNLLMCYQLSFIPAAYLKYVNCTRFAGCLPTSSKILCCLPTAEHYNLKDGIISSSLYSGKGNFPCLRRF